MTHSTYAMVLSGGGARGAFQAGVMRALYEIGRELGHQKVFRILTGVSAGAINAGFLAGHAHNLDEGTRQLCHLWRHIKAEDVFRTDSLSLSKNAAKLARGLSFGGISSRLRPSTVSLLDTSPLSNLLSSTIDFAAIRENIKEDHLHALCISATDYSSAMGVTFVEERETTPMWQRTNRLGLPAKIQLEHIMASSAIPLFFPPQKVGQRFYGDGCLRNTAPLSPPIHLGADHLFIVGVRKAQQRDWRDTPALQPTLGRVLSVLINAIFLDAIEIDLERLRLLNRTLFEIQQSHTHMPNVRLRHIHTHFIHPSEDLAVLASQRSGELPRLIRFLLEGLGSPEESSEILSYLMFEPGYCSSLVELGYNDVMDQKKQVRDFLLKNWPT